MSIHLPPTIEVFNRYAQRYDTWYDRNRVTSENEARLVRKAAGDASRPCVDIGGGTGYFTQMLGCVNIDPSIEMLLISKRKRGVESIQGFGERLPIRSGSIGLTLIVVTICFVESPSILLAEASRILKGGGRMVLCMIPRDSPWGEFYSGKKDSPFYRVARFLTRSEVFRLVSEAGLEVEDVMGTLSYPPWSHPYPEEPGPDSGVHGFICIRAVKL